MYQQRDSIFDENIFLLAAHISRRTGLGQLRALLDATLFKVNATHHPHHCHSKIIALHIETGEL